MPKETVIPFTSEELPQEQADYFERRYELECNLAALRVQHLQPVQKDLKTANKDYQARAGLQTKEVEPFYQQWKLSREADDFDKESEKAARKANLARAFDALAKGEQLDFIKVDAAIVPEPAQFEESPFGDEEDEDFGDRLTGTGTEDESAASGPKHLDGNAPRAEREEAAPEPHAAWGATDQAAGEEAEHHTDNEGELYQIGVRHGQGGNTDLKSQLRQHNLRKGSAGANSMEAGHAKGLAEFNSRQAAGTDGEGFQSIGHGTQAAE